MKRNGLTLVELLLGLVLLAWLGSLTAVVTRTAAVAVGHSWSTLDRRRTVGVVASLLHEELRDASVADISSPGSSAISFAAPVGDALICGVAGAEIYLPRDDWSGVRWPEPGRDMVRLLADPLAEVWDSAGVTAVGADRCPVGRAPALRIALDRVPGAALVARVVEPVRVSGYLSRGSAWFGLAPEGVSAPQPFAGPLQPGSVAFALAPSGLSLRFTPSPGSDTTLLIPLDPP